MKMRYGAVVWEMQKKVALMSCYDMYTHTNTNTQNTAVNFLFFGTSNTHRNTHGDWMGRPVFTWLSFSGIIFFGVM